MERHSFATSAAGQLSETNATYFSWHLNDAAEDRANYFDNLLKGVLPVRIGRMPTGERAVTLLELMTIRAFHSKNLKQVSLATAIGFRMRGGLLTDIPAILVFVARKIHRQWLNRCECLPCALEVFNSYVQFHTYCNFPSFVKINKHQLNFFRNEKLQHGIYVVT